MNMWESPVDKINTIAKKLKFSVLPPPIVRLQNSWSNGKKCIPNFH
jgi:hypothetical protein